MFKVFLQKIPIILLVGGLSTALSWSAPPEDPAQERLQKAIANPEYVLKTWIELPSAPAAKSRKAQRLRLREAILLALRYNPNIQNAELDRIIQRYQLRLAYNQFELQYALGATANVMDSHYQGVGSANTNSYLATPEADLKTKWGTSFHLGLDNRLPDTGNYNPLLNFSVTQPLLRGFGTDINEIPLLNAIDNEYLNKLNVKQSVIDQITQVITAYRALILSGHNLENQKMQLKEARNSFEINRKKIAAGQLEPTGNIQQSYQIESISLMVEQAQNDLNTATQDLLQVIGLDPKIRLSVPGDLTLEKLEIPDLKASIAQALTHNVQYLGQKLRVRADERAWQAAKNQQLWQLDLTAQAQLGTVSDVTSPGLDQLYKGNNRNESARLTLKIPLNDKSRKAVLINAKIQLEKDRVNLLAAKRALETGITNMVNTIKSQAKRYKLAQKQVLLARQSYDLEKKKLLAGISTALDVTNTQNQFILAQSGLINAKAAYLNQVSLLERNLGSTLEVWKIRLRYGE